MNTVNSIFTPQIKKVHKGKVRDSFQIDADTRMIIVTDRLSAFDNVLETPIPHKGAILNKLSNFWFSKTKEIIPNHVISEIDPNITLVKQAKPIKIEMIVRGYLTGSMWRSYEKGKRIFSGHKIKDGYTKNSKFLAPILTPTTKSDSDEEISFDEIVTTGLIDKNTLNKMSETALSLFNLGSKVMEQKGMLLVDTKYEFGLIGNDLVLIDEIHTPDSSRFWLIEQYEKNPLNVDSFDKEYVRLWLMSNKHNDQYPTRLPLDVIEKTSKNYMNLYEKITGLPFQKDNTDNLNNRIYHNLLKCNLIKEGFVTIVMGSPRDIEFATIIENHLKKYNVYTKMRIASAHKNGEDVYKIATELNDSIEPGAVIAVAGRSNGLGGALAANLNIPVINCPNFKDTQDMLLNINSSLIMPSEVPAATVLDPQNAALMALRSLNITRLKNVFAEEIKELKANIRASDLNLSMGNTK